MPRPQDLNKHCAIITMLQSSLRSKDAATPLASSRPPLETSRHSISQRSQEGDNHSHLHQNPPFQCEQKWPACRLEKIVVRRNRFGFPAILTRNKTCVANKVSLRNIEGSFRVERLGWRGGCPTVERLFTSEAIFPQKLAHHSPESACAVHIELKNSITYLFECKIHAATRNIEKATEH
ncbi:hypothetical protein BC830DRAFT_1150914 [Chytriomyces sp. MP71]|nr:hypothetical protein BC830DRAFT_1150914 [Chytriomyces sp. MP71]